MILKKWLYVISLFVLLVGMSCHVNAIAAPLLEDLDGEYTYTFTGTMSIIPGIAQGYNEVGRIVAQKGKIISQNAIGNFGGIEEIPFSLTSTCIITEYNDGVGKIRCTTPPGSITNVGFILAEHGKILRFVYLTKNTAIDAKAHITLPYYKFQGAGTATRED